MEVKTVRLNLKKIIEDLFCAIHILNNKNEEHVKKEQFELIFNNSSNKIKLQIISFIKKSTVVKDSVPLSKYFKKFNV